MSSANTDRSEREEWALEKVGFHLLLLTEHHQLLVSLIVEVTADPVHKQAKAVYNIKTNVKTYINDLEYTCSEI